MKNKFLLSIILLVVSSLGFAVCENGSYTLPTKISSIGYFTVIEREIENIRSKFDETLQKYNSGLEEPVNGFEETKLLQVDDSYIEVKFYISPGECKAEFIKVSSKDELLHMMDD